MAQVITSIHQQCGEQGYVYVSYGPEKYLRHVIASIHTLRRYDTTRSVACACTKEQMDILYQRGLDQYIDFLYELPVEHASIVGFKHHISKFLFFKKNIFLDSDIVWCKNPDTLWLNLSGYDFTITGNFVADVFFGAPKGIKILPHLLLNKRQNTLKKFDLTYLPRVQSGVVYASNKDLTEKVCTAARKMLSRISETHFQSRLNEKGRNEESCEWSLAMAMSKLEVPIYPWLNGLCSPQLDYISTFTHHDEDFKKVRCLFYFDAFLYSLRGIKNLGLQKLLVRIIRTFPGKADYTYVTPYCLHFGWLHQKEPFLTFADKLWNQLISDKA